MRVLKRLQKNNFKDIKNEVIWMYGYVKKYRLSLIFYICAGVLITIIPILILFLIFQKQVYSGMAAGAVKG